MKLTIDQINQIDETLVLNKVVYDDIKLELTDHIASDIEEIMSDENVSFEMAFKEVFDKWQEQLNPSRYWILDFDSFPKIVADRLMSETKKQFFYSTTLITVGVTLMILGLIKFFDNSTVIAIVNKVYMVLWILAPVLLIASRIRLKQSRVKTIYRSYFEKHSFGLIFMCGYILFRNGLVSFFNDKLNLSSFVEIFWLFCATFFLVYALLTFQVLYKHFQFEKKLFKA